MIICSTWGKSRANSNFIYGGIVDIEFMVEYRQIQENVRIPNTVVAMKRLGLNLLEEYEFLRNVESMLRLWSCLSNTRIETKHRDGLGLMLNAKNFAAHYEHVTESVRKRFEEVAGKMGS